MSGIRLNHPNLRSCTYTLIHEGRELKAPVNCGVCGNVHYHKTYHLGLDTIGDVVVSETVFQRLKEAGLDELKVLNEVKKPEPMRVDMNTAVQTLVVPRERKVRR
jgi:hypothetical protein